MNNGDVGNKKMSDLINEICDQEMEKFNHKVENKKNEKETEVEKYNNQVYRNLEDINKVGNDKGGISNRKLKNFHDMIPVIKSLFGEEEKKDLELRFLLNSSNGIMSIRSFWKVLGLENVAETAFGKLLYQAACNFNDNKNPNQLQFMTEDKFLQIVAIFTKKNEIDYNAGNFFEGVDEEGGAREKDFYKKVRFQFLYTLFDVDNNDELNKIDFRNLVSSFLEMVINGKYNNSDIDSEISKIRNADMGGVTNISQLMEDVLDSYVENVFSDSFSGETLTIDEWKVK
ncbi:MAG: hypothetical protein MJ252_16010 [archaeon]|nr:hypothetical protein [archaeon]